MDPIQLRPAHRDADDGDTATKANLPVLGPLVTVNRQHPLDGTTTMEGNHPPPPLLVAGNFWRNRPGPSSFCPDTVTPDELPRTCHKTFVA